MTFVLFQMTELSRVGGDEGYDFIRRVLASILCNELAQKYNCEGKKHKTTLNYYVISTIFLSNIMFNIAKCAKKF